MTTVPGVRSAVEAHLAEQLSAFAREFVADLEAQGRLVEAGGAGVLEQLRTRVEAGRNCPEAYHAAVDTIVEDCGYPSEVAMRIATALNRKGLIPGDEAEPRHGVEPESAPDAEETSPGADGSEPRHDRAPASGADGGEPVLGGEGPGARRDHGPASVPERRGPGSAGDGPEPRRDHGPASVPDHSGPARGGEGPRSRRDHAHASVPDRTGPGSVAEGPEPRRDHGPASIPDRVELLPGGGRPESRRDHAAAALPEPTGTGAGGERSAFAAEHGPASVPGLGGPVSGGECSSFGPEYGPVSVQDPMGPVSGGEGRDRASGVSPLVPPARGAIVLHLADRSAGRAMAEHGAAPVPKRVEGQVPRVRPAAARSRVVGWGSASARAVSVAASLQSDHLARLEAMQITADGERVTVAIKATCLDDWEYWLDAIGAARNVRTRTAGHAQVAAGTLDGVAVHLTAHGVPELLQEASDAAADPFYLWGRIYDLGMGQVDRTDRIWLSLGRRQDERGMPLLVLRGTDGPPYPLASIVMAHGPLTATPLPSGGMAGDIA
ncbi:BN159_2729 family protein [Streptomyces sp. NPDC059618]|uniref:BN159_2729 family protein n=1 Tax=Streptomyces sp. NPDC059618 TaxID=3346887 RepID=UPI0036D1B531